MGVASDEFFAQGVNDIVYGKCAGFCGNGGMEYRLEQQVADAEAAFDLIERLAEQEGGRP